MNTKGDAHLFLFVELDVASLGATFYLLTNSQARACRKNCSGSGNFAPWRVRETVVANDFSMLSRPDTEIDLGVD